jgi:predicted deacylase
MAAETLRVRDIVAARGEIARGYLTIGETPTAPIQVPVVIINGARPGPTLCLTAGVHAAEYPAIDAVIRTIQSLNPATLSGTVIAVPVVSMQMFQNRTGFLSPIDGLNLNRTAPGRADGSISEILVHVLLTEVISLANYHIDFHGGDLGEILWPYAGFSLTGNKEIDQEGETLARLYTPRIFALYEEASMLAPTSGSITHTAAHRGIVSMLAEAGSNGTLNPADVETHLNGTQNVMRYLGMLEGQPVINGDRLRAREQFIVSAQRGGLVRLKIEIGESIRAGQEVAEIANVFGDVV